MSEDKKPRAQNGDGARAERRPKAWAPAQGSPLESGLSATEVEKWAFPKIMARGVDYASDGRVLTLELSRLGVKATVEGGGAEPYAVEIFASMVDKKSARISEGVCDCPWSAEGGDEKGFCKHLVAVALVAGERFKREREGAQIASAMGKGAAAGGGGRRLRI